MTALRVLMTADTIGGVWTYALELARALMPSAVQVALATMGAPLERDQRAALAALPNVQLFESEFRLEWMQSPWDDVRRAGDWLREIEARVRPDIIHLNGYVHAALPWCAPVLVVAHSCVLSWWEAVHGEPAPREWDRYRAEVAHGLAAADLVVVPTQAILAALRRCHSAALPRARVIANARDPDRFRPGPKGRFVLAAGRLWDEAKNLAALERVAPRLRWPIYVAGEDCHPDGGRAGFSNVRFLGRLAPDGLAGYLAEAPIYALPARYEPFGLSVLEAALAGCALVLGDIASLRENWSGVAAMVPPCDEDALAAAVNRLISDPRRRAQLALRARSRALRFHPRRMAAEYLAAYRELALHAAHMESVCA